MTSLIYNTGTVSLTADSATVTGSSTGWAVALVAGGLFSCAGMSIPIASVESDTSLTLAYPWPGVDASGAAYAIARDTSEAVRAAWTNDRLATIIQRLSLVGIHPDGSGTLTERDALDPVPATGYLWLYAESGHDFAFYRKTASGWDGPFEVRGGTGGTGAAATIEIGDVVTVDPGDPATVNNSGTSTAAVFDFEIPKGETGDGDVNGPASSIADRLAVFDGTSGKIIKDSSIAIVAAATGYLGVNTTEARYALTVGQPPAADIVGTHYDKTFGLSGAGAAYFRGADTTNGIHFLMGTSTSGYVLLASMSSHPFVIRVNNAVEAMRIMTNGSIGIGTTAPAASALVELNGSTRGFLPPRMTNTQRDAISSPAEGLVIYSTTDHEPQYRNASAWVGTGPKAKSYTVATLPSASASGAGAIAYASDASGGAIPVFCDAANWRKFSDRSVVA